MWFRNKLSSLAEVSLYIISWVSDKHFSVYILFTMWFSHMISWIVVICFTNVSCLPSSTWHLYFEAQYTVFVLSVWMWNNFVQFAIDSLLLVRCGMLYSDGFTTTFTEILYEGDGQLLTELDLAHWFWSFFLAAFYIEVVAIYYYNFHTQKNNSCYHFGFLWRKQYVAVYWFVVSFPPLYFMQFTVTVGLSTTSFFPF